MASNLPFYEASKAATAAAAAAAAAVAVRDRQKKSTMACEMCRKRKVTDGQRDTANLFAGEMHLLRSLPDDMQLLHQVFLPMRRQHRTQTTGATSESISNPSAFV